VQDENERTDDDETIERWALAYVRSTSLEEKLAPSMPPTRWARSGTPIRIDAPGRPEALTVHVKASKQRGFSSPHGRARAMHTFFHHELQAAELFAFALLAYPEAPEALRAGMLRIMLDEIRHANLYAERVRALGYEVGAFAVRDWFWERIPACPDILSFLATMGLGFEAGNLDHASRYERIFRDVGDAASAETQAIVGRDEIMHVRFGAEWWRTLHGALTFDRWREALPSPLSPMLMRGATLDLTARRKAGLDEEFLGALAAWLPDTPSS
jgi:uncharacterized ferritin-like protein (DUF455 family)